MTRWTKRDRLMACIAGEPADRPPIALWRHWPGDDDAAETLAKVHLVWQEQYDWDFVKVSPPSSYCLRDWGAEDRWDGGPVGSRLYTRRVIRSAKQWAELSVADPGAGMLAVQLDALRRISAGLAAGTPVLATVFSPLSQAINLGGYARVATDMREAPALLREGLETIARSTIGFVEAAKQAGISGIFFAVRVEDGALQEIDAYRRFGARYDHRILEAAGPLWLNMVHLHGGDALFREVAKYGSHILNWHDRECDVDLASGMAMFPRAVCGGVSSHTLADSHAAAIRSEGLEALARSARRRHILGVGCMTLMTTPPENIRTLRELVEEIPCASPNHEI